VADANEQDGCAKNAEEADQVVHYGSLQASSHRVVAGCRPAGCQQRGPRLLRQAAGILRLVTPQVTWLEESSRVGASRTTRQNGRVGWVRGA
jgi:hypothetical protein